MNVTCIHFFRKNYSDNVPNFSLFQSCPLAIVKKSSDDMVCSLFSLYQKQITTFPAGSFWRPSNSVKVLSMSICLKVFYDCLQYFHRN